MATYKEQMQRIWDRYRRDVSADPVDFKEVADWAISKGLWKPRPADLNTSFARDMADAIREVKRTDNKGRTYRANIPVRTKGKNGLPLFVWGDIDDAPRTHVEKSFQQERRSIASDCYALAMKVEHYNDVHPEEEPFQVPFDFEEDVEEMKIANGIEEAA